MSLLDKYKERQKNSTAAAPKSNVTAGSLLETYKQRTGDNRTWFQKGAFEDGWQKGALIKTILGSKDDVMSNLWAGILGVGEKLVDAGAVLGTAMNNQNLMQSAQSEMLLNAVTGKKDENVLSRYQQMQEEVEKGTAEFVAKDLYDEEKVAHAIISGVNYPTRQMIGYNTEKDSIFGEKSDALVQSGGQLLAQMGVSAIPGVGQAGGMALMAATSFGSEAENAFMNDASYDEALLSATISAGAEILTEKIGGVKFGGKTLTDAMFAPLARKMTSKLAKVLIATGKLTVDALAEGGEEVLSGYASAVGQQMSYMKEKEIEELFSKEDRMESFLGGLALGGFFEGVETGTAVSKGINPISGLTKNEEAVVNKVYKDELAKKEKDGKLTAREKTKLYDSVVEKMERGSIDTDTIESVLGGDTYKGYQDALAQESKLKKEIEGLESLPDNAITVKQRERLAEARKQLEELDVKTAKSNLFSEVDKLTANDTKLRESYNERTRRGQAFTADLTKYNAKQQETVKKAIESGILNNSNRTHEFVDLIAKISANKGVSFDFADNAKLKESGFAIDGKQVNGFVTADGVTININSAKALNAVVGHEITHVLEGTDLYNELQSAIVEYAKSKGDYQGRFDTLTELYKDIEGADIDAELTADLVGDYLFTDADFVKRLSTEHRGVFQKLFDEIKHLCKLATAGTKEARELEKVKKLFEEAYRTETKNPTVDGGVRYALGDGTVKNASELSRSDLQYLLESAQNGEMSDNSYIPLRRNTPEFFIGVVEEHSNGSVVVENYPMAVTVEHIRQNMDEEDGQSYGEARPHGFSVDDIITISEKMGDPSYIVLQKNGRYAEVVSFYNKRNKQVVVAIDFADNNPAEPKNFKHSQYMNGYAGGYYNIIVTQYEPDNFAKYLNDNEVVYSKKEMNGRYQVGSGRIVTVTHDTPFIEDIISEPSAGVKEEKSPNAETRDVFGFAINKNANVNEDLLEELSIHDPNAEVDADGNVTVYHRTTAENADSIRRTGIMKAQEDALFFSSKDGGYALDYGDTVVKLKIPSTVLQVNDIFDGEVHFDIPLKYKNGGFQLDVSEYLQGTKEPSKTYSLSGNEQTTAPAGGYRITGEDIALAPTKEDIAEQERIATAQTAPRNDAEELGAPTREDIARMEQEKKLKGPLQMKDSLDRELEKLYRLQQTGKIQDDAYFLELSKVNEAYQASGRDLSEALSRVVGAYQGETVNGASVATDMDAIAIPENVAGVKQKEVEAVFGEKDAYVSKQANALYDEVKSMQKGKRVSNGLSYLLDTLDLSEENKAESYGSLRTALLNIRDNPNQVVNPNSAVEAAAREMLGREYDSMAEEFASAEGVAKSIYTKMESLRTELENNQRLREQSMADYDSEIARLQAEYEGKKNKNTKAANDILRRIERTQRLKSQVNADYGKRIDRLGEQLERISKPEYKTAMQRKAKTEEYTNFVAELVGDTSTWVDKKLGLSYSVNTLRRNLRDIVRDSKGNRDIVKADAIYDELPGKYNHNEAELKRESRRLKSPFEELKPTHAEEVYAHMLGEFQYNPDSKLSQEQLEEFYEKHKSKIDTKKVDKYIDEAMKTFDELFVRLNKLLREQGMKEIPYRKGYFPHFTNPKQGPIAKFFNWKPVDNEIPTSIAGLTEEFNPQRSWQSFDKQRTSDTTDYNLSQALDSYIHGALDWIYHIEDIQKRRALENYIRYVHSDEGIKKRIEEIHNNESYDADEAQELIDAVYAEAKNPLNNFVTDLRTGTNTLANKKSSMDRKAEEMTNRKIYSVMTNLNSRINANMVVGSFSSALTNFIPITQSWMEVSPVYSLKGMRDTIKSTIRDDGVVNKSDFLTNRLMNEEKLYQTGWDKVSEKAGFMMEAIDSFTSQTVWRSKYLQNIAEGMSEAAAIKNADQFAENVIAGRSRGNQPTIFDAKNPLTKIFTAFQLEVANQYGYMFKDAPQDTKNKGRLIKGYATAFLGAYAYNALYSSLVGRDAAFDPLSILEDLFKDLFGDDEKEPEEAFLNLADNVLEEVPFIGGLIGGGRVPLSSAIPYEGDYKTFITDLANGELSAKEMLKPIYYLAMPVAGGQIKKTTEGLKMFDDDFPIAGSYTDSGNLRFPVEEDSIADWLQAALFGQYANKNAREYFDNGWAPLKEKQIEEFASLEIPIADYREIRKQLGKLNTLGEKFDYINSLDLTVEQKNILVNNVVDRKEPVDMTDYDMYEDFDEFDFYIKNQEKYQFLKDNGIAYKTYNASEKSREAYNWAFQNPERYQASLAVTEDTVAYKEYTKALSAIKADKDIKGNAVSGSRKKKVVQYINGLDMEYGAKLVLYKMEYPSDDTYNKKIIQYVSGIEGFTVEQKTAVLKELGFTISPEGKVTWN